MLIKWKVMTINGTKAIEIVLYHNCGGDFTTIIWVNLPNPLNRGILLYIKYTSKTTITATTKNPTLRHFTGEETTVF